MVYQGHVENGSPPAGERQEAGRSLYDRLKPLVGAAKDLPPDASINVDHYLYGHPKR